MKNKIILFLFTLITFLSFPLRTVHADTLNNEKGGLGCSGGLGPVAEFLCNNLNPTNVPGSKEKVGVKLNQVIGNLIGFLTILAALFFIFQIIFAGYQWIGSGGDKNSTQAAQSKLTNSVLGLVIVTAAWMIVGIIGKILGINILNPGDILQTLGISNI
jgi:hypothetical protein